MLGKSREIRILSWRLKINTYDGMKNIIEKTCRVWINNNGTIFFKETEHFWLYVRSEQTDKREQSRDKLIIIEMPEKNKINLFPELITLSNHAVYTCQTDQSVVRFHS